ncbi:unnamed protein product [Calypogeia fissa]
MAGRGPRARYYAGANSLAIFSAQGSNPLQDCKVYGKGVAKVYDKSVKGYVYSINGGLQSKLQLPKDDSKIGLQLLHPFLVLQVFVPQGVHFSIELRVSDINNTRRKMYFSTSFSDIKSTPLHCQIPISMVVRNKWLSLAFNVADLFNSCFRGGGGMSFRSIDVIVLGPVCKLRRIFTMRCRLIETDQRGYLEDISEEGENSLPQEHTYALGVDTCVQTLDMASLQSAMVCINESQHDQDTRLGLEAGLSARKAGAKQQQGKATETIKPVHVAFGTRMPLPLSTVHINTNLPHDNKCQMLVKDRIGKVHFISDLAAVAAATTTTRGGGEANKPPGNMISRALNVASLDRDRRHNVEYSGESKLLLKTNKIAQTTGCSALLGVEDKDQLTNTSHTITIDGSGGNSGDEPHVGVPVEDSQEGCPIPASTPAPAQDPGQTESPKIGAHPQMSTNAECHVGGGVVDSSTTTSTVNKSPSKWAPKKKDMQISTNLRQQKSKEQRNKEYKHSRYMDSPPGSPPCGWDTMTGGGRTLSGDIAFHDHFLDGSWMNSQLSESIDAGNKPYCLANSLKEKILSSMSHSLSTRLDEDAMMMTDAISYKDESSKTMIKDQTHDQIYQSTEWTTPLVQEGLVSPKLNRVNRNRFGTDQGHFHGEDSEAISTYGTDYYSEGQQSWSTGSTSVLGDVFYEFPSSLSRGTIAEPDAAQKIIGVLGAQSSKKSDLQSRLPTNSLLAKDSEAKSQHGDEDTLMFDIHDDRFFPGHPSEKKKDVNGLDLSHSMTDSFFSTIKAKGVRDSFGSDAEPDTCGELGSSPQDKTHEMKTSSDFSRFMVDPIQSVMHSDTLLSSWKVPELEEQHSCHISSGAPQRLPDQEQEGPIKTAGRPDEDLDLLYDPTLDCYYDPKTNRYYELK